MDTSKVIPANLENDKVALVHMNCYIDQTMNSVADILKYATGT